MCIHTLVHHTIRRSIQLPRSVPLKPSISLCRVTSLDRYRYMYMCVYIHIYIYMCVRQVADQLMDYITEAELAIAHAPGMYGRIWYDQGLAFDEAYMILQDRNTIVAFCMPSVHVTSLCIVLYHNHTSCHPLLCAHDSQRGNVPSGNCLSMCVSRCMPMPNRRSFRSLTTLRSRRRARPRAKNPNAGRYNRFVQSGKSDHETKTNGCFGG